jgi:glycosyltransferase involved in cell wall biosynthesis
MQTALICTVKNEAKSIKNFLRCILSQTKQPDEVIIVDGGSKDGTIEIVEDFCRKYKHIKLIVKEGCNIPEGRNIAIRSANAGIIAAADACDTLYKDWFQKITAPLLEGRADVVAGYYYPCIRGWFEEVLSACIWRPLKEVDPYNFLPSSRSIAFYKKLWQSVGGYPQLLFAGEDLVFDFRLKKAGARFFFVPDAMVSYHIESSLPKFFKKWRLYGVGDGQANLWPKRYIIRFGSYTLGLLLLLLSLKEPLFLLLLTFLALLYSARPIIRLTPPLKGKSIIYKIRAYIMIPVVLAIGDIAKMAGYLEGVWERMQRFGRKWRVNKYSGHR